MKYQAVLFDLDGTLLDTIEDLMDAMNIVMAEIGIEPHDAEQAKLRVGDGLRNYVLRCIPAERRDDEPFVAGLCKRFSEEYAKRWKVKTHPYDGIAEMLTGLAERNVPAGVLTNKPDEFAQLVVGELLGEWRFAAVRGVRADDVKKPDPSGALEMAAGIGVSPAQCLYVGDTNTDMKTANAAGMFPVGATWGFRSREELLENGAKVLIDHPVELLGLLGE